MSFFKKLEHYFKETIMKNYANFNGRASREEYWMFVLGYAISIVAISIIWGLIKFPWLVAVYYLGTIIPIIALNARRMHDSNKSGWFQLAPIYNLVLTLTKGDHADNRFGTAPKAM